MYGSCMFYVGLYCVCHMFLRSQGRCATFPVLCWVDGLTYAFGTIQKYILIMVMM